MSTELNDDVWAEVAFDTLAVRAGTARTNEGEQHGFAIPFLIR